MYQELTGAGAEPPRMTAEQIDAEVRRRGPSGFDPVPAIRSLRIPALWVYGGLDMHVATRISVDKLRPIAQEAGRDFSWVVLPGANHSLVQTTQGLNEDPARRPFRGRVLHDGSRLAAGADDPALTAC